MTDRLKYNKLILFIAWLFAITGSLPAALSDIKKYNIQRFNINSGLSSDNLKALLQDREGYLWIASDNGINRFDGYRTTIYKPDFDQEKSFNSIDFNCIAEDKAGNLWFGTDHSGINTFNKQTRTVTVFDRNGSPGKAIMGNNINHILSDSRGRIWISSIGGLNLYYPESGKMVSFSNQERPGKNNPFGTISFGYEDSNGRILIGTWGNGLYIYDEEKDDFTQFLLGEKSRVNDFTNRVVRILEDRLGNYWLGTWEDGLYKIRIHNYQSLEILKHFSQNGKNGFSLSSNIVYCLYEDHQGSIWAGSPYGLNIITTPETNDPDIQLIQSGVGPGNISHNDLFSIIEDRSGIIWMATGGGGLNKIDPGLRSIDAFTIPEIIKFGETQSVRSFIVDIDSSLLVGVNGLGFGKYILSEKKFIPFTDLPRFNQIPRELNAATCFYLDGDRSLWIGTRYNGLYVISAKTGKTDQYLQYDSVTGDRSRMINSIYEDRFRNIWVGTNNGLFRFIRSGKGLPYRISRYLPENDNPNSISGEYISAIFEDSESNIWIGTVGGSLNKARNSDGQDNRLAFKHFFAGRNNPGTIRSNIVYAILEDQQKRLWIGTGTAGIALYNPGDETFTHFAGEAGLRGDAVFDIIEDAGNLWLSTDNGLVRFRQSGQSDYQAEVFTTEDGLQSNVFIDGASYKSTDGRIFFGGYYGFNVFKSKDLLSNAYIPPVVVTSIQVSNEQINVYEAIQNGINLSYNQNSIIVEFSALSFSQPGKNKYAYILDGLDADWNNAYSEGRTVSYSHIPAGRYTLRLKASNSSGLWNEVPLSLPIRVKPHPAVSWWAILIYSAVFIAILITIYSFLINNIKIKQAYEIEKIERKKEENINQFKFRFFTNISHELLTPLSVLSFSVEDLISKRIIDNERLQIMERNVKRIMNLISQLLDFRKVESGRMSPVVLPGRIDFFIEQICINLKPLAEKKNISVIVNGNGDQTIYFDPDKMDKIVCNLLSNALRYTPENGKIIINYQFYEKGSISWLKLDVIDSGKGIETEKLDKVFERFYQVNSVTGKTFGAGIGLALAKNLAENHKGYISVENEKDLGAKFSVNLPVSAAAYSKDEIRLEEINYQSRNFIIDHGDSLLPDEEESGEGIGREEKRTILIVEDNSDFRRLLKKHLSNYYHTIEAENGEQGYAACLNKQPDLVITDLMMPVMNGIELCRNIKGNIETSHIIVILLTAKIDEETRLESYQANADSYISKPVDVRTLYTRIESLLKQREKLIKRYYHGIMPDPEVSEHSELDTKFLEHIKSIIGSKIMNTEMNVLALSKEVGMSTSNLYRKITSLTGMSPVEFIRYIRLQSAAAMLANEGANVSEAAYSCGFNDLSYFCKSFKKQFGVSPKKYQSKA